MRTLQEGVSMKRGMGLNVLAFADVRTSLKLPDVQPDIVLLLGDIPSKMVSRIDKAYSCRKLGVLGNHCHPQNFEDTSVINMHDQIITLDGITFAGFEGSPVYKEQKFGQHTEFEAENFARKIGNKHIDILLTHSNPAYQDIELDNAHRGLKPFSHLIENEQIELLFHGHLHDPFVLNMNKCIIHSVYPFSWIPGLKTKGTF